MKNALLFAVGSIILFSGNAFSQAVVIDSDEYFKAIGAADTATQKLERRKIVKVNQILPIGPNEDGTGTRIKDEIHEFSPPNAMRQMFTETENGTKTEREFIKIGNAMYCREYGRKWVKTTNFCGETLLRGYTAESVDKFSKEATGGGEAAVTLYLMESTYGPEDYRDIEIRKIWVDSLGRITKEESKIRAVGADKDDYVRIVTYEYEPKLNIKAPLR